MADESGTRSVRRYRVLAVDDNFAALKSLEAVLETEVEVVSTQSPLHALQLLPKQRFHIVCSDYDMWEMNGAELLRQVLLVSPHVGRLLVTGGQEYLRAGHSTDYHVILKPFDPERLLNLVLQLGRIAEMKLGRLAEMKVAVSSLGQYESQRAIKVAPTWPANASRKKGKA
jgi:DNA-binding NtrC family response regulator